MAAVRGSVCGPVTAAEARPPVGDDGEWPISFVSLFTAISLAHTRARTHTHLSLIVVCGALTHVNRLLSPLLLLL